MTGPNADSPRNVTRYLGQNYQFVPGYTRSRDPTTSDLRDPKNQGYYPKPAIWINSTNNNLWALVKIANNLATWVLLGTGGGGPTLMFTVPNGTSPVVPTGGGNISLTSSGSTVTITGGTNSINFDVTGGLAPVEKFGVDAATAPGTNPVVPNASNQVTIEGGATYATGTRANPIRTNSLAANTMDLQIQLAGSNASSSTPNNFGVAQFDSNDFTVTSGFVQLIGGSAAIAKVNLQAGTTPIVPSSGAITFNGATVAAGSTPVQTDGTGANTMALQVQTSQAISSTNANNIGLAAFNSEYFTVDANGFVSFLSSNKPGATNLGIAYSAGTFTVEGFNGTSLSAANPAYITLQSSGSPGQLKTIAVTSNQSFTDGSGNIAGNLFGTNTAIAWGNDCPFYLYAVYGNPSSVDTIIFGISRVPHLSVSPAAGKLAITGSAVASTQGSMFLFNAPGSVTPFAAQPVLLLGSFRMQKNSSNNWTVQTLNTTDGVGNFQHNIDFTFPTNQNGASSGVHFIQDANAPVWTNKTAIYKVFSNGNLDYNLLYGVLSSVGTTSTLWQPAIPMAPDPAILKACGWYNMGNTGVDLNIILAMQINTGSTTGSLKGSASSHALQEGDITTAGGGGTSQFNINVSYPLSIA